MHIIYRLHILLVSIFTTLRDHILFPFNNEDTEAKKKTK